MWFALKTWTASKKGSALRIGTGMNTNKGRYIPIAGYGFPFGAISELLFGYPISHGLVELPIKCDIESDVICFQIKN